MLFRFESLIQRAASVWPACNGKAPRILYTLVYGNQTPSTPGTEIHFFRRLRIWEVAEIAARKRYQPINIIISQLTGFERGAVLIIAHEGGVENKRFKIIKLSNTSNIKLTY